MQVLQPDTRGAGMMIVRAALASGSRRAAILVAPLLPQGAARPWKAASHRMLRQGSPPHPTSDSVPKAGTPRTVGLRRKGKHQHRVPVGWRKVVTRSGSLDLAADLSPPTQWTSIVGDRMTQPSLPSKRRSRILSVMPIIHRTL